MIAVVIALAYLLGSVPWGYILGRVAGKDIRLEGSNNIGATNLWRVCGWKWGLAGFACDFLKGLVAVLILGGLPDAGLPVPYQGIIAGIGSVLGHNFPVWLRFKGGKGVATSAGVVAGLMWQPFAIAITVFVVTVAVSHYISLGSMLASVALVVAAFICLPEPFAQDLPLFALAVLLSTMLIYRHRANISRILAGTENRFPPPRTK